MEETRSKKMRISKDYNVRKNEILDTAQKLFFELGYEQTSVSSIIDSVGVAKGTFYYYFKSKEELLDHLAERFADEMAAKISEIVGNESIGALEKLNLTFLQSGQYKMENKELMITFMRVLYRDDNTMLRHKMFNRVIKRTAPFLAKIIEQGLSEKVFDTPSAEEAGEFILLIGRPINEVIVREFLNLSEKPERKALLKRRLRFYQDSIERILGAPAGSIEIIDEEIIDGFLEWDVSTTHDVSSTEQSLAPSAARDDSSAVQETGT